MAQAAVCASFFCVFSLCRPHCFPPKPSQPWRPLLPCIQNLGLISTFELTPAYMRDVQNRVRYVSVQVSSRDLLWFTFLPRMGLDQRGRSIEAGDRLICPRWVRFTLCCVDTGVDVCNLSRTVKTKTRECLSVSHYIILQPSPFPLARYREHAQGFHLLVRLYNVNGHTFRWGPRLITCTRRAVFLRRCA